MSGVRKSLGAGLLHVCSWSVPESVGRSVTPIVQEFQTVSHIRSALCFAEPQEPPQFFAHGSRLLIANDDACVVASPAQEFRVETAKIGGIVSINGAPLFRGPDQLFRVRAA